VGWGPLRLVHPVVFLDYGSRGTLAFTCDEVRRLDLVDPIY